MPLQGPFAVIADQPARDVVEALRAAGAYPIIEARWADAVAVLQTRPPHAVILAEGCGDRARAAVLEKALDVQAEQEAGLFTPVIARVRDDGVSHFTDALAIAAKAPAERLIGRVNAALRVRNLHATVLRRMRTLAARSKQLPDLPDADPLDEASVVVAGRGPSYPSLCTAVGAHVGVMGALTIESAARALRAHEIDGMIIGDGFGARVVETLLTVLAEERRFHDLPVAVAGNHGAAIESFAAALPNLERVGGGGPERAIGYLLPYIRLHSFARRLKRMLASLDAPGRARSRYRASRQCRVLARSQPRRRQCRQARCRALDRPLLAAGRRPPQQPRGGALGRPPDAPGRFRLPRGRQIDLHRVHRDRPQRGACGDAADRKRPQEAHARRQCKRRQQWRQHRADGDACDLKTERHH